MARRGATENPVSTRFDDLAREADGDFRDWLQASGEGRPLRTEVTVERPRTAMTRNDSPDIPFEASFNAYRGCEHGCIYCFARPTHAWHGLSPGLDFESRLFAKPDGPALLREAFAKPGYRPSPLALGTNTDPYQPIEARFRITRAVLELCLEARHPVSVTTKSARVLDDLALLAALAKDGLAAVMVSVTTLDPALARAMEPRAAAPHRRLAAIRALAGAGVPVAVSASPMIPGLNDHELEAIVAAAAEAGASAAAAMPIRLPHEVAPLFAAWLRHHRPDRAERVLNGIRAMRGGRLNDPRFGHRQRGEGPWAALLAARLERLRRDPRVLWAEPNAVAGIAAIPNDPGRAGKRG
ncbi:MAG: PA0069 family radical SAM protein, partial [Thermaurantiacus tibetensis]